MHIRRIVALRGPNIWANYPVIEALVDLGHYEELPSNLIPGFNERLMSWLPTMIEHRCTIGERGGFFQRLATGTWLGHVLEHVTIELQGLAGTSVGFGRARDGGGYGLYKVVVESPDETLALASMREAHQLILAAINNEPYVSAEAVARLRELRDDVALGPSSLTIVRAAQARGIPQLRLNDGSLVLLGQGAAARRFWASETDQTGAVAGSIAQDKQLSRRLLAQAGVPVPAGAAVASADAAWAEAQELGLPVVVKPQDGNKGRGVSLLLEDEAAVRRAYDLAAIEGTGVLVEKHIPGVHHRVLLVSGKVVAVARGEDESVLGDGVHSVRDLVELANRDPLRVGGPSSQLSPLVLDAIAEELLSRRGWTPDSIPGAGERVVLHLYGDATIEETDSIHPAVAARCATAARTIGLDVAGLDLVALDIGRPLEEQGGAIVEVNASPGLLMHLQPLIGRPREVGEAIVASLFRTGNNGRVPLFAVTGTRHREDVATLLGQLLRQGGQTVGVARAGGLYVGHRRIDSADSESVEGVRRLIMNPLVEAIVCSAHPGRILDEGVGFDRAAVAILTDFDPSSPTPREESESEETRLKAVRVPIDAVLEHSGTGVVCADLPDVAELARHCKGTKLFYSLQGEGPAIAAHRAEGGPVAYLAGGELVLERSGARETLPVSRMTFLGNALGSPSVWVPCVTALWASGCTRREIEERLQSLQAQTSAPPKPSAIELIACK